MSLVFLILENQHLLPEFPVFFLTKNVYIYEFFSLHRWMGVCCVPHVLYVTVVMCVWGGGVEYLL